MRQVVPSERPPARLRVSVDAVDGAGRRQRDDLLTIEEPLEIRLLHGPSGARAELSLSVTMRTPGHDIELALGFLAGEAIIRTAADVLDAAPDGPPAPDKGFVNVVKVELAPACAFAADRLTRHTFTTSSCGVCGKASLDAVRVAIPEHSVSELTVGADVLRALPDRLRAQQVEFARTGGLHAAATFDSHGRIVRTREDVGRHNALDKLIGSYLVADHDRLGELGLMLSGRASFELVQKAAMAGISLIAAIGPPSSLALELAEDQNITLVGFLRADRFNLYCGSRVTV